MRTTRPLPALLVGLALAGVCPADTAKTEAARIGGLVEQLGSDTFAEREAATAALAKIGMPALGALRKAIASKDGEIRKRSKDLLTKLEKEAASAEVLTPTRVHLVYKNTPLKEALADLNKKTGARVVLLDPAGKLKDKRVTLDTGKTTFWDALDRFCDAAGVAEGVPSVVGGPVGGFELVPAPRPVEKKAATCGDDEDEKAERAAKDKAEAEKAKAAKAKPVVGGIRVQIGAGFAPIGPGGIVLPGGFAMPGGPGMPGRPGLITLVPGKRAKGPADVSSSIRVRVGGKDKIPVVPDPKEIDLVLEVTPEPRLRWQSLVGVTIDKALDDNGTELKQVVAKAGPAVAPGFGGGVIVFGAGGGMAMPGWGGLAGMQGNAGGMRHYVPVKFAKAAQASKSLAELRGTIAAFVQLPAEAMMTVENLAKAKTVNDKTGTGELAVTSYKKGDDGTVTIHFTMKQPQDVTPEMHLDKPVGLAVSGLEPGLATSAGSRTYTNYAPYGLTLRDAKGNVLFAAIQPDWRKGQAFGVPAAAMDFIATYKPAEGGAAGPAKLVFTGRRVARVDVPFTLKKVPLE